MNAFKKLALVAAMSSMTFAASAMTSVDDADLSQVAGQDGVSIAADLNINIASFVYTDTDAAGGSISFKDIKFTGAIAATMDIMSKAAWAGEAIGGTLGGLTGPDVGTFAPAGDVVRIGLPQITTTKLLNISVARMEMGNSTASFGSIAINGLNLAGTTAYIWAH
jgi:hypothetical protein